MKSVCIRRLKAHTVRRETEILALKSGIFLDLSTKKKKNSEDQQIHCPVQISASPNPSFPIISNSMSEIKLLFPRNP